jgi:hypothetical protein
MKSGRIFPTLESPFEEEEILVIGLENGSHIRIRPFPNERATKANITAGRRRATTLDLIEIFWRQSEGF